MRVIGCEAGVLTAHQRLAGRHQAGRDGAIGTTPVALLSEGKRTDRARFSSSRRSPRKRETHAAWVPLAR